MRFVPVVTEKQFITAEYVIAPYEKFCVSLADRVRVRERNVFFTVDDEQNICGVIYLHNVLFHCLPFIYNEKLKIGNAEYDLLLKYQLINALPKFLSRKSVRSISGTKTESQIFIDTVSKLGNKALQINDYTLMSFAPQKEQLQQLHIYDNVQRARLTDANNIFPLHTGYLKEEVLPDCRTYHAASARHDLEQLLSTRTVFLAKNENGKIVAKAGIHAEGQQHSQIGGVYTLPEERGKHFAHKAVTATVVEILRQKKQPTLFVKNKNAPAISVYKKIGFVPECDYMIVYY